MSDIVDRTVSDQPIPARSPAEVVRRALAEADRRRRAGASGEVLWRAAPIAAAGCLAVALAGRWRGSSPLWALGIGGGTALAFLVWTRLARRSHPLSDASAARLDEAAGLGGELRSANWFASRDRRDAWTDHHLDRAAVRLAAADWDRLYPTRRPWRAQALTAVLALAALALALSVPGRRTTLASAGAPAGAARLDPAASPDVLLPELQKQLEALLAAAESGAAPAAGTPATPADLRRLIAALTKLRDAGRLKDLARAMSQAPSADPAAAPADMKTLAERAQRAAQAPAVAPEARDALETVAREMNDAAQAAAPPSDGSLAAGKKGGGTPDAAAKSPAADVEEIGVQSLSDAESGGAGIIMMSSRDDSGGKSAQGSGLGGGSDQTPSAGRMADLEAALRQETIEASADSAGDNVQAEARRKTEEGRATLAYAGTRAAAFDRGAAAAPPPVPEGRRAAVRSYFLRKQ